MLKFEDVKKGDLLGLVNRKMHIIVVLEQPKRMGHYYFADIMWLSDQKYVKEYCFFKSDEDRWFKLC